MNKIFGPNLNERETEARGRLEHRPSPSQMCFSALSSLMQHRHKKKNLQKCTTSVELQTLTSALNTHTSKRRSGMWATLANCENIWRFMYSLHDTVVWKLARSFCPDCGVVLCTAGARQRIRGEELGGRADPQTTQLAACHTDKQ